MNKTRYSATEFGGNKPTKFRLSGTLNVFKLWCEWGIRQDSKPGWGKKFLDRKASKPKNSNPKLKEKRKKKGIVVDELKMSEFSSDSVQNGSFLRRR